MPKTFATNAKTSMHVTSVNDLARRYGALAVPLPSENYSNDDNLRKRVVRRGRRTS